MLFETERLDTVFILMVSTGNGNGFSEPARRFRSVENPGNDIL
jgi:hypothetical protein